MYNFRHLLFHFYLNLNNPSEVPLPKSLDRTVYCRKVISLNRFVIYFGVGCLPTDILFMTKETPKDQLLALYISLNRENNRGYTSSLSFKNRSIPSHPKLRLRQAHTDA